MKDQLEELALAVIGVLAFAGALAIILAGNRALQSPVVQSTPCPTEVVRGQGK